VTVPNSMQSAMAKCALEQLTFVQRVKATDAHEQARLDSRGYGGSCPPGYLVGISHNGLLAISLSANLEKPEVVTEQLKHDHSQGKDVCLLIVLLTQQDL